MKEGLKLIPEVFFDIIAYFLPGSFFLVTILFDKSLPSSQIFGHFANFKEVLIVVFGGYICGHMLTTLSTLIIVKPLNYMFGNPLHTLIGIESGRFDRFQSKLSSNLISEISSRVEKKFRLKIDEHTFFLCENYIRVNYPDIGFLIRKRHAFEHLGRNLALASLILLFVLDYRILNILLALISLVSLIRYLDYRISWPKAVYENFFLLSSEEVRFKDE